MTEWQMKVVKCAMTFDKQYRALESVWLKQAMAEHGDQVDCQKGCCKCCKQLTLGTMVSGVVIAGWLFAIAGDDSDPMDRDTVERMMRRLCEQGQRQSILLEDHNVTTADPDASCDITSNEAAHLWFQQDEECALLVDGECIAYDFRPPACSSYYVAGGRAACEKADSRTMIPSLRNDQVQLSAYLMDEAFLNQIMGKGPWTDTIVVAPLGVCVRAACELLQGKEQFSAYINSTT